MLADLEQLAGPCLVALTDGDPEDFATLLGLLLALMTVTGKSLLRAMASPVGVPLRFS